MPGKHTIAKSKNVQLKVQALAQGNMCKADIAKAVGVHPSTIGRYLAKAIPELQALKPLVEHRADLLMRQQAMAQSLSDKIIASMDNDDIDALSPEAKARCLVPLMAVQDRAHQQERLERGLSTQNMSSLSLVQQISQDRSSIMSDIDKLKQEIANNINGIDE